MPQNDYGDNFEAAQMFVVGQLVTGDVNRANDSDYFKFVADQGREYRIETEGSVVARLYDSEYNPIPLVQNGYIRVTEGQTYYITITGNTACEYSFRVFRSTGAIYAENNALLSGVSSYIPISSLQSGFVYCKFDLVNTYAEAKNVAIIMTLYTKSENAGEQINIVEKTIEANSTEVVFSGFNIRGNASNYAIRMEVWDSITGMELLTVPYIWN